jgi:hypothetical protein
MKTIKKVTTSVLATGISVCSFAQINLGLQSTTQAVSSAAINTTAISGISNAAVQSASNTATLGINKVVELKGATTSAGTTPLATGITKSPGISAGSSNSVQGSFQPGAGSASSSSSTNASLPVSTDNLASKGNQAVGNSVVLAKELKTSTIATANEVNQGANQTTSAVNSSANAGASADSKTSVTVTK